MQVLSLLFIHISTWISGSCECISSVMIFHDEVRRCEFDNLMGVFRYFVTHCKRWFDIGYWLKLVGRLNIFFFISLTFKFIFRFLQLLYAFVCIWNCIMAVLAHIQFRPLFKVDFKNFHNANFVMLKYVLYLKLYM